jgi:membrane protease YdiL (CAAX protease family)
MVFAVFVPFMLIALVVNLTERSPQYRWITTALLALSNSLVLLSAVPVLLMRFAYQSAEPPAEILPYEPDWGLTALSLAITGVLSFLPLWPRLRRWLSLRLNIDAQSSVHTMALVFAVYLVGLTLAQFPLLGGMEGLDALDVSMGSADLWIQALAMLLLSLIAVGLGLRRDGQETAERLGLRWPAWQAWPVVLGLVVLLEGLDYGVSLGWSTLDPAGYELVGRVSQELFGGFFSLGGALALGLAAGLSEETLYRGALQPRFGVLLTSILFASSHIQYGFSPALLVILVISVALGWLRKRWGLVACIALHALYNMANVLLASYWP